MNKSKKYTLLLGLLIFITGCVHQSPDAQLPVQNYQPSQIPNTISATSVRSIPTSSFALMATRIPGSDYLTPTPDPDRILPTLVQNPENYIVQSGDYLSKIALNFSVSVADLIDINEIMDPNNLPVGQLLEIPPRSIQEMGDSFKIIPDSELVFGPMSIFFDLEGIINQYSGYLSGYHEFIEGDDLSGAEIIDKVSRNYSINPRLLLAILEYRSGWLTEVNPQDISLDYPLGLENLYYVGLYKQLVWAADTLNRGYYLWKANALSDITTVDGITVPLSPTINAGTAGVQFLFANLDNYDNWIMHISSEGFFRKLFYLYGFPFDLSIDPLVPVELKQPIMILPFEKNQIWAFTGGPHGGWDTGSAWAALDFAPPGEAQGCIKSDAWVTAVADGLIVRSENGAVVQDLDGDGFEQTGWVVLYMHIDSFERVALGEYVYAGEPIGHPSCEGGISDGTHLHLARKFNGEWIPADGSVPFNLGGWISSGTGVMYDGFLTRGNQVIEAFNGNKEFNQIQH